MRYIDYQEKSVRGTFGFPIQLYYVDYTHPQYEMPPHWHLECELILVLKGHFDLSVNGNAHTLHAGESILCRAASFTAAHRTIAFMNAWFFKWRIS